MPSTFYSALVARITALEASLLPQIPSTQIHLSQREIDLTSSYLLLSVAELERFIEQHCEAAVKRSENKWNTKKVVSATARALVLAKHVSKEGFEAKAASVFCGVFEVKINKANRPRLHQELDSAIKASFESYRAKIKRNNGTHALRKLLYPLGLYENRLDTTLLTNLEAIANKRGFAAHESVVNAANVIPHPSIARNEVHSILQSLKVLDSQLSRVR